MPKGPARSIRSIISTVAPRAESAPSIGQSFRLGAVVDAAAERRLEIGAELAETRLLDGKAGGECVAATLDEEPAVDGGADRMAEVDAGDRAAGTRA